MTSDRIRSIWIRILWSIVVLFAFSLLIYIKHLRANNILGIEIFPYFISPIVLAATVIVEVLRRTKMIDSLAFVYVLTGTSNAVVGLLGAYFNLTAQERDFSLIDLMFVVNIMLAILIFRIIFMSKSKPVVASKQWKTALNSRNRQRVETDKKIVNNLDIDTVIYKLQKLLYGHNYQVVLGLEKFSNCQTIDGFKMRLKNKFPNTNPESVTVLPMTPGDFWEEIEFALEYRGDSGAGVELGESEFAQFINLKRSYLSFLSENIRSDAAIFSYPDETGIPGYPVFWDFRFIILSRDSDALFVYGSASD